MSWQATHWARGIDTTAGDGKPIPGGKLILLLLADLADEDHTCFPGQARLAKESEQGERTVRRQLAALESAGLIRREARYVIAPDGRRVRTSDRFRLPIDEPGGRFPREPEPKRDSPEGDLPANMAARNEGDLPATGGRSYRPRVAGEQPEEQPDSLKGVENLTGPRDSAAAPPVDNPRTATATPGRPRGWDEHGPLAARCREHIDAVTPPACRSCGDTREAFELAELKRAAARKREADRAWFEEQRKLRSKAGDTSGAAKRAREALRAAKDAAYEGAAP